jgi:hypothetical protein
LLLKVTNKRNLFGGLIITAFGLVGVIEGYRLGTGSLTKMGPGYVPIALGFILLGLGIVMAASQGEDQKSEIEWETPEWRGWACIIAGVAAFIVLGQYAGLVPAAFFSVFISALGDRTATLKGAILLAIGTTVFGVVLFHYLLSISIPLFWW